MIENILFLLIFLVPFGNQVELDYLSCGIDPDNGMTSDTTYIERFPWLGTLYYTIITEDEEYNRATTMVILIHRQYVIGCSEDISAIPKTQIRTNTRVLLGETWDSVKGKQPGYEVDKYIVHPEYKRPTLNTMAIVKLVAAIRDERIWPICPPTAMHLPNTPLYNIIIDDMQNMKKTFREMTIVKKQDCDLFYKRAKLSYRLMRPTLSICAVAVTERRACVWEAGSALASRDPWGRWRLVGFGVRGPGCGAPSRYLNIINYISWFENVFVDDEYNFRIMRQGPSNLIIKKGRYKYKESNEYGDCISDEEKKYWRLYHETSYLTCDQLLPITGTYKFVLTRNANVSCIKISTLSAVTATKPYIWIHNICDQGKNCHEYLNSTATLLINFSFTFSMTLIVEYLGQTFNSSILPDARKIKLKVLNEWLQQTIT